VKISDIGNIAEYESMCEESEVNK